jgi:hypothetical protein
MTGWRWRTLEGPCSDTDKSSNGLGQVAVKARPGFVGSWRSDLVVTGITRGIGECDALGESQVSGCLLKNGKC